MYSPSDRQPKRYHRQPRDPAIKRDDTKYPRFRPSLSGRPSTICQGLGLKVTQVSYLQYPALHCEAHPVSNMLSFSTAGKRASVNQLVQTEPLVSSPPFRLRVGLPYWQMAVLAGVSLWLYAPTLSRLVGQWWQDPNFSHGFFVPAFSAFVIWQERARLASLRTRPSWRGMGGLALALCVLVIGQMGAELFLTRFSLVLLLASLIVLFLGWNYLRT